MQVPCLQRSLSLLQIQMDDFDIQPAGGMLHQHQRQWGTQQRQQRALLISA